MGKPWKIQQVEFTEWWEEGVHHVITGDDRDDQYDIDWGFMRGCIAVTNSEKHAKMIVALPDLLEACKGMLDFPKNGLTMDQAITAAQKAVAKAEGAS